MIEVLKLGISDNVVGNLTTVIIRCFDVFFILELLFASEIPDETTENQEIVLSYSS